MTILFLVFCFSLQGHASSTLDKRIKEYGLLPVLRDYCNVFTIGKVMSQHAIKKVNNEKKRNDLELELKNAHNALVDLDALMISIKDTKLSVKEKCEIIYLLTGVKMKMTENHEIGVGNIELSAWLSMFISGYFLSTYSEADETMKNAVFLCFSKNKLMLSEDTVREALRGEDIALPIAEDNSNLYKLIVEIAALHKSEEKTTKNGMADLDILVNKMLLNPKNVPQKRFGEFDANWMAWDILLAIRLEILCCLSKYIPTKADAQSGNMVSKFETFRAELSKLSPTETQIINAKFPTTCDGVQRDAYVLVEIKGHVKNNGSGILGMVYTRFKDK